MIKYVQIKVGICIAYDWEMLKISLPIIYNHVDKICLSIDKNRKSWAGNCYDFDNISFLSYIKEIDLNQKIQILEENYFIDFASHWVVRINKIIFLTKPDPR